MINIFVKGNFLVLIDAENKFFIDNLENCLLSKENDTATSYNLVMRGANRPFVGIAFTDIVDENDDAYASQSVFEEYIYQNTGIRFVQPLITLDDLNDVVISAPSNGQIIQYNATSGKWENVSPSALGGDMLQSVYDVDNDGVVDSSEKLEFIAKNSTGVTIAKTKVVYISGATGQKPNITLADASLEITSSKTIGITRTSIANNADGYVITHGTIHDINTSAFADGDALWLSETAGEFTNTIPAEPAHAVFIGYVAYAHATQGKIILHIQNGYELDELHGVKITSATNKDLLSYNSATGLWEDTSIDSTYISDFETAVNALITTSAIPDLKGIEVFRGATYRNNSTTEDTYGGITIATTGSTSAQAVATTSFATKQIRKRFYGSVVSSGRYTGTRGSALLWYVGGGFLYACEVFISDQVYASGCRQFYGMYGATTDLTYTDVTTVASQLNIIGVGSDTDTNLQIFHNDGSGTATKVDLGASFPANRTAGSAMTNTYTMFIYNAPNSTEVVVVVIDNENGTRSENTITTDLPATTQGLNFTASRCMGGGGGATNSGQFDLVRLGVYSL